MKTGEYIFKDIKHIKINKVLMDKLYASALYFEKNKCILEVLAPHSIANTYEEYDEDHEQKLTVGESWAHNLKSAMAIKWPLEHANYYIEVNGIKIGKNFGRTTGYRYEPEIINNNEFEREKETTFINSHDDVSEEKNLEEVIKPTKHGVQIPSSSPADDLKSLFEDEDLIEAFESSMSSLFEIEDSEEGYSDFQDKWNEKERKLFYEFRNTAIIPDYLNNESMMIADLIFKDKNISLISNKIESLKFIIESYKKQYLTRINLKLPFGKFEKPVKIFSKEWSIFTEKISIEGIVEVKKDNEQGIKIPSGKKAVFVTYETIDNVLIVSNFSTREVLQSYKRPEYLFDRIELLKEKGINGFNKYTTCAGYVDENAEIADLELFSICITCECNKEFVLL
ncbi:hypothetical protein SH2C18_00170 [Clostridium sediminicola]|uniref:hypothetical protein n=1 Tax=Clostridium sediminicola TaxID=3114879 RepID=UPI0031F1F207